MFLRFSNHWAERPSVQVKAADGSKKKPWPTLIEGAVGKLAKLMSSQSEGDDESEK
jgi:hypothetical protein